MIIPKDPVRQILSHAIKYLKGEKVQKYLQSLNTYYETLGKCFLVCIDSENVSHRVTRDYLSCCLKAEPSSKKLTKKFNG
jgi:hypothetical protein